MKRLIKTKLLEDKIEVRDYEMGDDLKIIHCKSEDYKNCAHGGEDYMVITKAQQKKGKVLNTQRSQFYPYKYYKIYTFLWKPSGIVQDQQFEFTKDGFAIAKGGGM